MIRRQLSSGRWAHLLTVLTIAVGLAFGVLLRNNALYEVRIYTDLQYGITVLYPASWSVASNPEFVFRTRNLTERGFPTTIQISVRAVPDTISPRQVFDTISLERLQSLASYNVVSSPSNLTLQDGVTASVTEYAYADSEADPFLERIPVIIRGQDVITIRRGQAIIISFLSSDQNYEQNLPTFLDFLQRLRL
jgi:hypothetical protein